MIKLVHMNETDFDAFQEHAIVDYAQDKVKAGNWTAEDSLERSRQAFQKLLPEGVSSPGQHLFSIVEDETGEKVGMIWFAATSWDGIPFAFIYDFVIYPQFRRRGYGRQALQAVEAEVKAVGYHRIGLHVFGHNQAAFDLYEKSGYQVTNINMAKEI